MIKFKKSRLNKEISNINTRVNTRRDFGKSLKAVALPLVASGFLLGPSLLGSSAFAADNADTMVEKNQQTVDNTVEQSTIEQSDDMMDFQFSEADLNNDDKVNWAEIKVNYNASLDKADWDEDKIFTSFDRDNNTYLDRSEFEEFYAELKEFKQEPGMPEVSVNTQPNTGLTSNTQSQPQNQMSNTENRDMDRDEMNGEQLRSITVITGSENPPEESGVTAAQMKARALAQEDGRAVNNDSVRQQPDIVYRDSKNEGDLVTKPVALTDTTGRLTVNKQDIIDKEVYNLNDQHIGEVEDLVYDGQRGLQGAVVEVGGFLGIGDREVFVHVSQLRYDRAAKRIVWQSMMSEDELDNLPEYDKDRVSAIQ